MERKKFLQSIGKGVAFAVTFSCLGGCLREELDPLDQLNATEEIPVDSDSTDQNTVETPDQETPTEETPTEEIPVEETPTEETPTEEIPVDETPPEEPPTPPPSNALFTIDLTSSEASNLGSNGGYIIKSNIVVAKNLNGEYVAATVICSHDLLKKMVFRDNEYYCTEHAARFDQTGLGLNSKGSKGLKIHETILNGNLLSILP